MEVLAVFRPPGDFTPWGSGRPPAEELGDAARFQVRIGFNAVKNPKWGEQFRPEERNWDLERFAVEVRQLLGPRLLARVPETTTAELLARIPETTTAEEYSK